MKNASGGFGVNFLATPRGPLHKHGHYRNMSAIDYGRVNKPASDRGRLGPGWRDDSNTATERRGDKGRAKWSLCEIPKCRPGASLSISCEFDPIFHRSRRSFSTSTTMTKVLFGRYNRSTPNCPGDTQAPACARGHNLRIGERPSIDMPTSGRIKQYIQWYISPRRLTYRSILAVLVLRSGSGKTINKRGVR